LTHHRRDRIEATLCTAGAELAAVVMVVGLVLLGYLHPPPVLTPLIAVHILRLGGL